MVCGNGEEQFLCKYDLFISFVSSRSLGDEDGFQVLGSKVQVEIMEYKAKYGTRCMCIIWYASDAAYFQWDRFFMQI